MVKVGKKLTRFVLAVIPGDSRVDLQAIRALCGATYVSFAPLEKAEELAGTISGTVLPFSYDQGVELIVDPRVLSTTELFFNAARLDRSVALATDDYLRIDKPRLEHIVEMTEGQGALRS